MTGLDAMLMSACKQNGKGQVVPLWRSIRVPSWEILKFSTSQGKNQKVM